MNERTIRFFGGSPAAVLLRLIILSFIVGVVLNALGLTPLDVLENVERLARRIYDMGFGAIDRVIRYFLLGAVIVFPVWLILRLLKVGRG